MADGTSVVATPNPDLSGRLKNSIVYATGDIHGRLDLLETLVGELRGAADAASTDERITAVFLGDYIDRGPESRGVLSRLIALRDERFCGTVFLRGNHEQMMLDIMDGQSDAANWLRYGGQQTLRSYGVEILAPFDAANLARLPALLHSAVPASHLDFLRRTELLYEWRDYVFVHAGLRPDRLLGEQSDFDLLSRRHSGEGRPLHGKIVVHGHTPSLQPIVGRWRIALDTKAYASGALTALRLQDGQEQLYKISASSREHKPVMTEWELNEPSPAKSSDVTTLEAFGIGPPRLRPPDAD